MHLVVGADRGDRVEERPSARCWQYESHCIAAGVHGLVTSASPLTVISPPASPWRAGVVAGVVSATVVSRGHRRCRCRRSEPLWPPSRPVGGVACRRRPSCRKTAAMSPRLSTTAVMARLLDRCLYSHHFPLIRMMFCVVQRDGCDVTLITGRLSGTLVCAVQLVNDTERIRCAIVPPLRDQYLRAAPHATLGAASPLRRDHATRHAAAVAGGVRATTIRRRDLSVFTAAFLAERGYCCDSGCRHCPYVID